MWILWAVARSFDAGHENFGTPSPMKTEVLTSTPLAHIAKRMHDLTLGCSAFWIASAFLSRGALLLAFDAARKSGASVRVLTGTYGNSTRKQTFHFLVRKIKAVKKHAAKIWNNGSHGNFHAKLYLWKMPDGSATAWIGSANFTDTGLREEGEILLQISGNWSSNTIRRLAKAFCQEWDRAAPITEEFVSNYIQAPRRAVGHEMLKRQRRPPKGLTLPSPAKRKMYMLTISRRLPLRRHTQISKLLRAPLVVEHFSDRVRKAGRGDYCYLVDTHADAIDLVEVRESGDFDGAYVFAYAPIFEGRRWSKVSRAVTRLGDLMAEDGDPEDCSLSRKMFNAISIIAYPNRTSVGNP